MEKGKWWLKACPKCGGDLFEDRAPGGQETKCLQCGRILGPWEQRQLQVRVHRELEPSPEEVVPQKVA